MPTCVRARRSISTYTNFGGRARQNSTSRADARTLGVLNQGAIANLISGASGAVMGIASGGGGRILGGTAQSIASVMELSSPVSSSIGSNGSIAFNNLFSLVGRFLLIADESLSKNGRPLCAPRQISTMSGFIQVHNADVDMIGSPSEKEAAISFLEGGFYYE